MRRFEYFFSGPIEKHDFGRMAYNAVFLPDSVLSKLPMAKYPRLRIDAEIGGLLTNCGLMAAKKRRYLLLSEAFMKQADLKFGQNVEVYFNIADQDAVEVPEDLEQAIFSSASSRSAWEALSAGKRRSFAFRVSSAARTYTREQRILEVIESIRDLASKK
jgi:Bacteriocin-protection, YdeI or OmpD-Associated/Domain of unknown function (DUF1905)